MLNTISFNKGIASWDENPYFVKSIIEEYGIDFGIVINEPPTLSEEFKINLSSDILYLLRVANVSKKKIEGIKNELSIYDSSLLDLDATYRLIQGQKIGSVSLQKSSISGKIAESYMQYAIADAVYQQGKHVRLHHSFEPRGNKIKINNNLTTYKIPCEMDFILTYKNEDTLTSIKNQLEKQHIHIVENPTAPKTVLTYK